MSKEYELINKLFPVGTNLDKFLNICKNNNDIFGIREIINEKSKIVFELSDKKGEKIYGFIIFNDEKLIEFDNGKNFTTIMTGIVWSCITTLLFSLLLGLDIIDITGLFIITIGFSFIISGFLNPKRKSKFNN